MLRMSHTLLLFFSYNESCVHTRMNKSFGIASLRTHMQKFGSTFKALAPSVHAIAYSCSSYI